MAESTKRCTTCRNDLPLTDFYRMAKSKDGRQYNCRACANGARRAFLERNPGYNRGYRSPNHAAVKRKHKYGLSSTEYDAMLAAQGGKCAICLVVMEKPCVDHCHETGRVRGLLCSGCNFGIGHLRDDPSLLRAAAGYLDRIN